MHRIQTVHHQNSVQIARQAQMHMDASLFKKLASHPLCHYLTKRHFWHSNHQGEGQSSVLNGSLNNVVTALSTNQTFMQAECCYPPQKLYTILLKHHKCVDTLRSCMETVLSRLVENPLDNITKHWNAFKETVNNASLNTLGKVKCKHQDWYDESDQSVQDLH